MTPGPDPTFDRLRRRRRGADPVTVSRQAPSDHEGKRALFSDVVQPPTPGSVAVTCEGCGVRSVLSLPALARRSLPGLHLPVPRRGRPAWRAWISCPACERRCWVHVAVRG